MKFKITNGQFMVGTLFFIGFLISLMIITNLYMSLYESQEDVRVLKTRLSSLHSYFNKFTNISFPISYSLGFYENYHEMPVIYIITPTNNRKITQLADLTRLRNTLWLVPKVVWIVVEDSSQKTKKIANFLKYSKIPYVHLNEETPSEYVINANEKSWSKPRGILQRNKGIAWLREHSDQLHQLGVVYFADDDNTYDIRLFEEMRNTKKVSVWPVAFVGELKYERPICRNGKVVDWFLVWGNKRPFPLDMAGFAVNLNLLMSHPSASFSFIVQRGMQESHFLSHLVGVKDLEAKADNCTKIYVWHTKTQNVLTVGEAQFALKNLSYDQNILDLV